MNKADRVLILYDRLLRGERIKKRLFMDEFSVGRRSFDRYIEAVRLMLSETFAPHELLYDAADHSYYLSGEKSEKLRGMNVLPLLLLLFDSKAFGESDITSILQGLSANLSSDERGHLRKAAIRLHFPKRLGISRIRIRRAARSLQNATTFSAGCWS